MTEALIARPGRAKRWALAVAVLVVVGLVLFFGRSKFFPPRTPVAYAPLFVEIEPTDGAVVRGTEAWIRWSPIGRAKGRVLWRKAGEADFRAVDAAEGEQLLARFGPLQDGAKYEYVVEQTADGAVQRSSLRTVTVRAGLAFNPMTVEKTIQRDYDQTVTLSLHNSGKEEINVAAKALAMFEDLPADIVGPGSVDEPVLVGPGEKMELRLAIAAVDATRQSYDIPVEAGGSYALARVRVGQPKLKLSFRIVGENPGTLAKTIEILNTGETIGDLAVRVAPPNEAEISLEPSTGHAWLGSGGTLRVVASPVLYLEFQSLKVELEAAAAGQSLRFPLEFQPPSGKRLIGVRTGTTKSGSSSDTYCTNKPNTCGNLPGPEGNGPASPDLAPSIGSHSPGSGVSVISGSVAGYRLASNHEATEIPQSSRQAKGKPRILAQGSTEPFSSRFREHSQARLWLVAQSGTPSSPPPEAPHPAPKPGECGGDDECAKFRVWCVEEAKRLYDQYRALVSEMEKVVRMHPGTREKRREQLLAEYEELKKRWDNLSAACGECDLDIGSLGSGEPAIKTSPPTPEEEAERTNELKDEYRRLADVGGKWPFSPGSWASYMAAFSARARLSFTLLSASRLRQESGDCRLARLCGVK